MAETYNLPMGIPPDYATDLAKFQRGHDHPSSAAVLSDCVVYPGDPPGFIRWWSCIWSDPKYRAVTPTEAMAIHRYMNRGGENGFNWALRKGGDWGRCMAPLANELNRALRHVPTYSGTVYRGVRSLPEDVLAEYRVGHVVSDHAFTSTSKDERSGREFTQDLPTGWFMTLHVHSCGDVSNVEFLEQEVLCPTEMKFLVKARDNAHRNLTLEQVD